MVRPQLMTQAEAARALGRARSTVLAWVAAGQLRGEMVAGRVFLVREDVESLARELQAAPARAAS